MNLECYCIFPHVYLYAPIIGFTDYGFMLCILQRESVYFNMPILNSYINKHINVQL